MKVEIDIEKIAKECKIVIKRCNPKWGGAYAYTKKGSNCTICGYKTRKSALQAWFFDTLDGELGKILLKKYLKVKS